MSVITIDLSDVSDDLDDLPDVYLPTKSSTSSQTLNELSPSNSKTPSEPSGQSSQTLVDLSPSKSKNCSQSSSKLDNIVRRSDKKEQKRRAVEERQAARQAQKIYKPGECMKYMTVEMHPSLLETWYCADVGREVAAGGARVTADPTLCDVRLVTWSRTVQPSFTCSDGMVGLTPSKERLTHGLYIASLDDMAQHVERQTLSQHMAQAARLAGCKLTLVLYGVKDYFKQSKRPANKTRVIEQIDLEMALTDLVVSAKCGAVPVNTPNELALTVAQFTKAVAEAPYKQAKRAYDEQADFYMRGDNKKCVAISKNGDGVGMLWQQMIAMLPKSSLETARAICGKYKTPKMLYQSLQEPNSISSVADLGVSRSAAPGSRARRVGNEFARKLHILFTADDGNTLVE